MFVDLDGFKANNDRHGHEVGDRVLVAQTQRVRDVLRPTDVLGRVGGDEFVVLCEDLDGAAHLDAIACRVARRLREPVMVHGHGELRAPPASAPS